MISVSDSCWAGKFWFCWRTLLILLNVIDAPTKFYKMLMHPSNLNLVQLSLPQQFRTLLVRCQADTKILSGNWTIPLCSWWINRIGRGGEVRRAKSIPYYQFAARLTVSISIEVDKNNATMHRCREGAQLHHHRPLNRTIAALYSSKDSAPIKITA